MYLPQETIRKKRDGLVLSHEEISEFIDGLTKAHITDSQAAAFAMAVFLNGMNADETVALTCAMRDSGISLNWDHITQPIVDKHSTGGVGDNVSLILAPLMASCSVAIPMISGRGLGHTGGTLDKLEAIAGYNVTPDISTFKDVMKQAGCAIVSASANLAPADKKLYAIRDVTATVESVPLITASILSKKLAAGLDKLVLDVKCGNGATTKDPKEAEQLAQILVDVANGAGLRTVALITDMNEPLASSIGNALEVKIAIECLQDKHQTSRLMQVVLAIASEMLLASGLVNNLDEAQTKLHENLANGLAAEHFNKMVKALGGPDEMTSQPDFALPKAPIVIDIPCMDDGFITHCDARALGMLVVKLGGGRSHPDDQIDYSVGLSDILPIGTQVKKNMLLCRAHLKDQSQIDLVRDQLKQIFTISEVMPQRSDVVLKKIVPRLRTY